VLAGHSGGILAPRGLIVAIVRESEINAVDLGRFKKSEYSKTSRWDSDVIHLIADMLRRSKAVGLRALRDAACLPVRALGATQRGLAVEGLAASMVSEVEVPGGVLRFETPTPLLRARARAALSKEADT